MVICYQDNSYSLGDCIGIPSEQVRSELDKLWSENIQFSLDPPNSTNDSVESIQNLVEHVMSCAELQIKDLKIFLDYGGKRIGIELESIETLPIQSSHSHSSSLVTNIQRTLKFSSLNVSILTSDREKTTILTYLPKDVGTPDIVEIMNLDQKWNIYATLNNGQLVIDMDEKALLFIKDLVKELTSTTSKLDSVDISAQSVLYNSIHSAGIGDIQSSVLYFSPFGNLIAPASSEKTLLYSIELNKASLTIHQSGATMVRINGISCSGTREEYNLKISDFSLQRYSFDLKNNRI